MPNVKIMYVINQSTNPNQKIISVMMLLEYNKNTLAIGGKLLIQFVRCSTVYLRPDKGTNLFIHYTSQSKSNHFSFSLFPRSIDVYNK